MGAGVKEQECEKVGSGVWGGGGGGVQTDRERRVMGRERVGTQKKGRGKTGEVGERSGIV